ncbi:MAG: amidohydrolase family protein [Myxococcota bacterium]|nr:amidohydrolase family protein [Myxococcota bacterium]
MIDFHSHFFSRPFFDALASLSPLEGSVEEKLSTVVEKTGLELPDNDIEVHWKRWETMLDESGVDHLVSFASLPVEAEALLEARELAGGRMSAFCLIDPTAEGAAARAEALLGEMGFKGLLLFPAMHCFDPGEAKAAEVFEVADQHSACVVVHCGMLQVKLRDVLGLPRPYDFRFADPLRLIPAANRHRNVSFVIPHFGAGLFRETLMVGSQCENVFVDSSSSNSWMDTQPGSPDLTEVFRKALGVFSAERVLFGTDSSTLPRGWRKDLLAAQLVALEGAGVSAPDQKAILDGNARRLLRI